MKAIDSYTIQVVGIPSMVLMERAALKVVECVKEHSTRCDRMLVICGMGNNGADGIAAARMLLLDGYQVDVLLLGEEKHATEELKLQLAIARKLGIFIDSNINIDEYTIIIDALFGIGLSRPVTGIQEAVINKINTANHIVFAVDIPSGLSADNAKPLGIAVKADYTITFGLNKIGMILYPGCEYAGEVMVADIGFPGMAVDNAKANCLVYDSSDVMKLPTRSDYSNKGTFGKVLIIAGSVNMAGACFLSAKAAYRTGAGLVKVLTVEENRIIMQSLLPEALLSTYKADTSMTEVELEKVKAEITWASAIVFGPGIGVNDKSKLLLDLVIKNAKVPVILDADALNILSKRYEYGDTFQGITRNLPDHTIVTPHLKELSRLMQIPVEQIADDLLGVADLCTNENHLIYAIKDARTIVAYDKIRYINTSGNCGMATGGSGDVLTGIIAALVAQGLTPLDATMLGVFLHGLAGDKAAEQKGKYALMASDLLETLAEICNIK